MSKVNSSTSTKSMYKIKTQTKTDAKVGRNKSSKIDSTAYKKPNH